MGNDHASMGMGFTFGPGDKKGEPSGRKPEPPRSSFGDGRAPEVAAEPFRILVLADFRGMPEARDGVFRRVRASTLDEDFAKLKPTLRLDVKDHLSKGARPLEVVAELTARKQLRPDELLSRIPALAPLVKLVDDLDALDQGKLDPERLEAGLGGLKGMSGLTPALAALDRALRAKRSGGSSGGGGGALASVFEAGQKAATGNVVLDDILSMVDSGGPAPAAQQEAPASGSGWKSALKEARSAAQDLLEAQLGEVLKDPQTRRVEAAWRGLELLLARCPREAPIEVEVLDTDPAELEATLVNTVARRHSAPDAPPPPSLVVVDASFSRSAADVARLELIAETGEALQAPIVVGVNDAFLGTDLPSFAGLDHPAGALERGLEKWNGARRAGSFRWLVAAANRVLLRTPHVRGQKGSQRAGEHIGAREDLLWGNAAWAVAAAAAGSVARTGWPADLTDPEGLSDLPMVPDADDESLRGPLEAALAVDAIEALSDVGVIAPTGPRGRDVARITRAPTAVRAGEDEPRWASSLGYQLVATRIAGALLRAKDRLAGDRDPEATAQRVERYAAALVGDTGPGSGATAQVVRGSDGPEVEVEVRTGKGVMGGVTLTLGLGL